tara:strand:- start:17759 stop:17953 length:195 start_codon:yes stop_codon:yes gene_type:complete
MLIRFIKATDTTTGRYMPGEIAVFPEHEANYHISMNRAECANDLIETAALVKEPETRKQTKAGN